MAKISPEVFKQELDNNANPLAGGKLFTFEAGTSTPKQTFTSEDESAANTNPIILDSAGRYNMWLQSGSYKMVLTDADDVEISTEDDITGGSSDVYASSIVDVIANRNIVAADINSVFDCVGTFTLPLLDVATAEEGFIFTVRNSGTGVITLDPDGAELIDGITTKDIQPDGSVNVNCNGTAWITTNENYGTTNVKTMTITGNNTHTGTNEYDALVIWSKGADVASSTALPVLTDGNSFDVTGTTSIETINTLGVGTTIKLQFDDVLTLTHDAADLILPTGANITTAAGDVAEFIEYASGDWRCTNYSRASGDPLKLPLTLGTPQATTSGSSKTFSGIPAGTKRITMSLVGVSSDGGDDYRIQLGDSGGLETTGYIGAGSTILAVVATTAFTDGFGIRIANSSYVISGTIVFTLVDSATNTWSASGNLGDAGQVATFVTGGSKSLSAELTQVALITADTFDAGSVNITFE